MHSASAVLILLAVLLAFVAGFNAEEPGDDAVGVGLAADFGGVGGLAFPLPVTSAVETRIPIGETAEVTGS